MTSVFPEVTAVLLPRPALGRILLRTLALYSVVSNSL